MDRTAYDRFFELEQRHFWRIAKRRLVLEWVRFFQLQSATGQEFLHKNAGAGAGCRPGSSQVRILDVGGACSLITKELGRFGEVECIEPDSTTVEFARQRLGVNIRHGWFPDASLAGPYDIITMLDVLEHIEDDAGALTAARRLLRDDGLLVVTVPALRWLWSQHDRVLHHYRRYEKKVLLKLLEDAGFKVLRASYYTSLLLPVLAVQRLAGRLRRRGYPAAYDVRVPFRPINVLFGWVMWAEKVLLRFFNMPVGSSLIAVCAAASKGFPRFPEASSPRH